LEIEITVALIALGASVVGGLIGAGVSIWISKQQLTVSNRKQRLEVLDQQYKMLQNRYDAISKITYSSNKNYSGNVDTQQIDYFSNHLNEFLAISNHFPEDIENEFVSAKEKINKIQLDLFKNQKPDFDEIRNLADKINKLDKKIEKLLRTKLRDYKNEIDKLTIQENE